MFRVRFGVMVTVTVCILFSNFAHPFVICKQVKPLYKDFCLVSINLERARWIGFMIKPLITLFIRLVAPVAEAYQKGFLIITRICLLIESDMSVHQKKLPHLSPTKKEPTLTLTTSNVVPNFFKSFLGNPLIIFRS